MHFVTSRFCNQAFLFWPPYAYVFVRGEGANRWPNDDLFLVIQCFLPYIPTEPLLWKLRQRGNDCTLYRHTFRVQKRELVYLQLDYTHSQTKKKNIPKTLICVAVMVYGLLIFVANIFINNMIKNGKFGIYGGWKRKKLENILVDNPLKLSFLTKITKRIINIF